VATSCTLRGTTRRAVSSGLTTTIAFREPELQKAAVEEFHPFPAEARRSPGSMYGCDHRQCSMRWLFTTEGASIRSQHPVVVQGLVRGQSKFHSGSYRVRVPVSARLPRDQRVVPRQQLQEGGRER
jgi:hypothetical protein